MAPRRPRSSDLPATLRRSDEHAQATWQQTHDSAAEQYGDGERAHRTAFSALKHTYEKVGDHWEPKDEAGPSDAQAAQHGAAARNRPRRTAEGVDANASKQHLLELARRLEIRGRSRMTKAELVEALMQANRRETARARG
ncbi:ChaB family protein [Dactylosporangium sp. CA-139114]|uniref:ChaB family protein n=1 Tax=Dactylosporangium sp. CA-139114 TaxID=3239931 RepID=UPI003D98CBF1